MRQKVQAEVDVSIAVKMITIAQNPVVKTIVLFAGDRDFIDAIDYITKTLKKQVIIIAFQDTVAQRIQ